MSDLNKKVSFQTGEKEGRKEDDRENIDIVTIYENYSLCRNHRPPPLTTNSKLSVCESVCLMCPTYMG